MKKRWIKWVIGLVFACNLVASATVKKGDVTLVLMPRSKLLDKVGLDLTKRYSLLFITYKVLPSGAISLHGWSGSQWVKITLHDYVAGTFFKKGPTSALVVEKENVPAPKQIIPPKKWCKKVVKIKTTKLRPLLHLTGRYFNFPYKYWSYFSKRAQLPINDINPENLNVAWYQKSSKQTQFSLKQDLKYWQVVRVPAPIIPPVEKKQPAPKKEEPQKEESVKSNNAEPKKVEADPFKTKLTPAVVIGAGTVPEDKKEE